jgi:competence protein ComEC
LQRSEIAGQTLAGELRLDLTPPVRLDLWALLLAGGIAIGTVSLPLVAIFVAMSLVVAVGALVRRDLVPEGWLMMAILSRCS